MASPCNQKKIQGDYTSYFLFSIALLFSHIVFLTDLIYNLSSYHLQHQICVFITKMSHKSNISQELWKYKCNISFFISCYKWDEASCIRSDREHYGKTSLLKYILVLSRRDLASYFISFLEADIFN